MAVDNVITERKCSNTLLSCDQTTKCAIRITSLTSLAYQCGVDVTARHRHARQHVHGRSVATYPVTRAWDSRKPHFLSAVQAGTVQPIPALYRWWSAVEVYSISHAYRSSSARPAQYIKII